MHERQPIQPIGDRKCAPQVRWLNVWSPPSSYAKCRSLPGSVVGLPFESWCNFNFNLIPAQLMISFHVNVCVHKDNTCGYQGHRCGQDWHSMLHWWHTFTVMPDWWGWDIWCCSTSTHTAHHSDSGRGKHLCNLCDPHTMFSSQFGKFRTGYRFLKVRAELKGATLIRLGFHKFPRRFSTWQSKLYLNQQLSSSRNRLPRFQYPTWVYSPLV